MSLAHYTCTISLKDWKLNEVEPDGSVCSCCEEPIFLRQYKAVAVAEFEGSPFGDKWGQASEIEVALCNSCASEFKASSI